MGFESKIVFAQHTTPLCSPTIGWTIISCFGVKMSSFKDKKKIACLPASILLSILRTAEWVGNFVYGQAYSVCLFRHFLVPFRLISFGNNRFVCVCVFASMGECSNGTIRHSGEYKMFVILPVCTHISLKLLQFA